MKKRKTITKEELIERGIAEVTEDAHIIRADGTEFHQYYIPSKHPYGKVKAYKAISMYDPDTYKNQLEKKELGLIKSAPGTKLFAVHRIVYAWFNNECPGDLDVDHIDNDPFNNHIDNLQLLARKRNLAKRLPRNQHTASWSEEKLKEYHFNCTSYKLGIAKAKDLMNSALDDIDYIREELNDMCKANDIARVKEYKRKLDIAQDLYSRYRSEWHDACTNYRKYRREFKHI